MTEGRSHSDLSRCSTNRTFRLSLEEERRPKSRKRRTGAQLVEANRRKRGPQKLRIQTVSCFRVLANRRGDSLQAKV